MVQQLVDVLTSTKGGEDFEVIKLKNANAVDVARMLEEIYNGRPQNNNNNRGGGRLHRRRPRLRRRQPLRRIPRRPRAAAATHGSYPRRRRPVH